ncbi:MAG: DUF2273 domain-containing protein [Coriobacteriaceae bacterium]|nr:DUF2273 domain-containing protein [Coriobacteriaceae bacterium]
MSENNTPKAPRAIIEQEPGSTSAGTAQGGSERVGTEERAWEQAHAASQKAERSAGGFQDATIGFFEGVGRAAWAYADAHPHATLYGIIGFVVAVLVLVIGLWDTIVIAAFSLVGIIIGRMVDDGSNAVRFMHRFDCRK